MNASPPNQQALSAAIAQATHEAVEALFREHAEDVYDIALITTGEAHAPFLSAWSWQAPSVQTQWQGPNGDAALRGFSGDSPYALERAMRLDPPSPLVHWLAEAGEP